MKIVSFNEINKCIRTAKNLLTSGIYNIYGRGTFKDTITKSSLSEGDTLSSIYNQRHDTGMILEFYNLTIGDGVNLPVTNEDQTAYVRVNGTLTVNGHLHMDNRGGYISSKETSISVSGTDKTFTYDTAKSLFDTYPLTYVNGDTCCSKELYYNLVNYGMQETLLNCKVSLPGSGPVGKYVKVETREDDVYYDPIVNIRDYQTFSFRQGWHFVGNSYARYLAAVEASKHFRTTEVYFNDYYNPISSISGAGEIGKLPNPGNNMYIFGGCGGGTLVIYAESVINMGRYFNENGIDYPLNIHANGGSSYNTYGSLDLNSLPRGGGTLIIAARHLVIGENGSITCDGGDGNGLMSLAGREPSTIKYTYSNGSPNVYTSAFAGGAGFSYIFKK